LFPSHTLDAAHRKGGRRRRRRRRWRPTAGLDRLRDDRR
jgi:hypothetical protein